MPAGRAAAALARLPLVDAHCHPLLDGPVGDDRFERALTEADRPGAGAWDSPAGLAVRRWCPPVLDLPPFAPPADYLARRRQLGPAEVAARLVGAAGLVELLVDAGIRGDGLGDLAGLAAAAGAGARVSQVVRLERVAEDLAAAGTTPDAFAGDYVERLRSAAAGAVATKSVVAYRHGLDVAPARPAPADVSTAAARWLGRPSAPPRLDDALLLRFVLWAGADVGLPLQIHTGFGDRDLTLPRSDPSLLQPLLGALESTGVPVVLLHAYPYHRQAGWLAAVYPNVYVDVGLTVGQVGARAEAVLGEVLELAPLGKVLFSTDGFRLPELFLVGAAQFRHSFGALLDRFIADGALSPGDADRAARMVGAGNARRLYRLGEVSASIQAR